jgi:hypothetical protein
MQLSKHVLLRVNIERILFEEVIKLRPEICQPAQITNAIEKKADLERMQRLTGKTFSAHRTRELVEQF